MDTFAQGEIYGRRIDALPENLAAFNERDTEGRWIVSHSESGHHHLLDAAGVTVMERVEDVPNGMRILHAIVEQPTRLWQNAGNPHDQHELPTGIYEIRIAREFDPLMQQARRVAD